MKSIHNKVLPAIYHIIFSYIVITAFKYSPQNIFSQVSSSSYTVKPVLRGHI